MSTKHTPGPWMQAAHSPTDVVADEDTMIAMARDGLNGIARDRAVANARLIAAAPDLLAALQEATRCLAWHEEKHGVGMDAQAIEHARAAIAKATGEQ